MDCTRFLLMASEIGFLRDISNAPLSRRDIQLDCKSDRIRGNMLPVAANYIISGRASHQIGGGLECSIDLLRNHQMGFMKGAAATQHQLHHPQCNDATRLDR
jgi:hypothetical protein